MLFLEIVYIILMMFWLFYGYVVRDPNNKYWLGGTLIPFCLFVIIGLIIFGVISTGSSTPLINKY